MDFSALLKEHGVTFEDELHVRAPAPTADSAGAVVELRAAVTADLETWSVAFASCGRCCALPRAAPRCGPRLERELVRRADLSPRARSGRELKRADVVLPPHCMQGCATGTGGPCHDAEGRPAG